MPPCPFTNWLATALQATSLSPWFRTVAPLFHHCDAGGVTSSGLHQSQHFTSVCSSLGGDTLGWMIQWPLETCLRDSSSIPVHSYKSSFLDESVVMAEPSAALGEGRGGFSLLRNLWTVGQHSESWNSFWSSQPLGLYYRLESSKSLLVTVVAHSLRN